MSQTYLYQIFDPEGKPVQVELRRDRRLKKTIRWTRQTDGSLLLRVPVHTPRTQFKPLLADLQGQLNRRKTQRAGHTDADLQERAERINRQYFNGKIEWRAIKWVSNMNNRLGSCTQGGSTDGHIRISNKIKTWPDWVLDYVIAHELTHLLHSNHSKAFWATLKRAYPLTEKAEGFIEGLAYARNQFFDR